MNARGRCENNRPLIIDFEMAIRRRCDDRAGNQFCTVGRPLHSSPSYTREHLRQHALVVRTEVQHHGDGNRKRIRQCAQHGLECVDSAGRRADDDYIETDVVAG